jgi:cytoskeletal protein CcmA (bactofilin family)
MGRNLSNLFISQSYQFITQISGSELQDGLGNTITGSLLITSSRADNAISASQAISASFSNVATSASYALVSTSSSFATNANNAVSASVATSASFAVTASYALNAGATVSTGSLLVTASAVSNVITFTKGDGSTFPVTVATGSATTVNTGSLLITASINDATTTYTKGDGSTFALTVNNVVNANSASLAANATSASFATTAISSSFATNANTATSASYAVSASQAQNAVTASFVASVVSASYALSSSQAANATTASFAQTIANGLSPTFANVTASNVMITGTASVALLYTQTVSSSVIYSSGSNQFGDASNDVQTLYGTFNVVNGPTNFTGSVNSVNGYTGSLLGTASFADNATSASIAVSASQAISSSFATSASVSISSSFATSASQAVSSSFATTASFALNVTPIDTSSFATTGSNTFIGNETISGSLNVSGSVTGNVLGNNTDTYTSSPRVQQVVTLTQAEYNSIGSPDANTLYIISGSVPFNSANFATTGSNTFVGNQTVTGSVTATTGFTGSLQGTASFATTASFALNAGATPTLQQVTTAGATTSASITINNTASADYWMVDTVPFADLSSATLRAGRIDGADQDFILAGRNFNGTIPSITMTDGVFVYNESAHQFTGSVGFDGPVTVNNAVVITGSLNITSSITASNVIGNWTDTFTSSSVVSQIVTCTQAEYNTVSGSANAANTLYVISDSTGGGQYVSGSLTGNVNALTITSQTASLNCSAANFFTLTLVSGSTTHVSASNLLAGQTINLRVTQASSATGSISFTPNIKQVSGSAYVPTAVTSSVDIVTFIAFDTSSLFLSNIKNFI